MTGPSPYRAVIENVFQIVDKDGVTVPFLLNSVQRKLDEEWSRRNIIPKARQGGVSSYVIARFLAKCMGEQNRTCVIMSHEREATQRLLQRAHFIVNNMRIAQRPELGRSSTSEIFFRKTNSKLFIGTAGSRTFGHGDTITDLHLSEAARYEDPQAVVSGTFPAAERGEITVESTGNGVGNWYHRMCVRARAGHGFTLHFFPWTDMPEYQLPFDSEEARASFRANLSPEYEEPSLLNRGITLEQLAWRRERLAIDFEENIRKFKEAYPLDFDECFQSSGYSFFNKVRYEPTDRWRRESRALWVLDTHPRPNAIYVVGADPAGGVGSDASAAVVFCLDTREQVAEFADEYCEPDAFGRVLFDLGRRFNNAYVNVERNNHGGTTLAKLLDLYPMEFIHRGSRGEVSTQAILSRLSHYGTLVSPANRGVLIGTARTLLASEFTIHSPRLKGELDTFIEKEGRIEADVGCHDDLVFATCHALVCIERAAIVGSERDGYLREPDPNPFGWDALFPNHASDRGYGRRDPVDEEFGVPRTYH